MMKHYSTERKEAVLAKLLPPHNMTVAQVAEQENIAAGTLYNWRDKAKKSGIPVPGKTPTSEQWSAEAIKQQWDLRSVEVASDKSK